MKTILIAEDDPASRELLVELIRSMGYAVVEATNGQEALDEIRQRKPDALFLDIQMPVIDGYSVLQRIRANPAHASLPVIACTAYAMHGDQEKALAAGFDAYIAKPIRAAALRSLLEKTLA